MFRYIKLSIMTKISFKALKKKNVMYKIWSKRKDTFEEHNLEKNANTVNVCFNICSINTDIQK